jgi:predicted SprT family Zn-dependent metalloprotease
MLLADAEKLAKELMAQFGLIDPRGHMYDADHRDWRFEFDNAVRRFGRCNYSAHKITLSRELVSRNDREQVEDTIRHEIAHALCKPPIRVRGQKQESHGAEWKAMCAVTGAKPERCYDHEEVDAPRGDWTATCRGCGAVFHKFRLPKRDRWCAHKDCVRKHGRLTPIQKLVWRHKDALPDPSEAQRRKAIEAIKAALKREQEMEAMKDKIAGLEKRQHA